MMNDKFNNATEEVAKTNIESVINEKTYTQAELNDITQKVRDNSVKLFLKENFGKENPDEFKKEFSTLESNFKETKDKLDNTIKSYKINDIKNVFVNELGGKEEAFETLINANQNLLEKDNVREELLNIKNKNQFLFMKDETTIVNLNEKAHNKIYSLNDGKTTVCVDINKKL